MRPDRSRRFAGLLALALLVSVLAGFAPSAAPPAHAGEGTGLPGNFVALDKPARVLSKTFAATTASSNTVNVTAAGVQGIPLNSTRALSLIVTLKTNDAKGSVGLCSNWPDGSCIQYHSLASTYGVTTAVSAVDTAVRVDTARTTNHLKLTTTKQAATVTVDVVGYYTSASVGGGLVPTRPTAVLDTRYAPEVIVPAGGTLTRKLTGGIIPEGASAAYLNVAAGAIKAAGTLVAVPATVDPATAYPVMTFWNGAVTRTELAMVKLPADGRVTFKNTSTQPVHIMVWAHGYATGSPATGADWQPYPYADGFASKTVLVQPGGTREMAVAGFEASAVPDAAVALPVNVTVSPDSGFTPVAGTIRFHPKGQAASPSVVTFSPTMGGYRETGALVVPGHLGSTTFVHQVTHFIVIENLSTIPVWVRMDFQGHFTGPSNAASAGGDPLIGVARTSAGPCYGYSDPANQGVSAACADDYDQASVEAVWTPLGGSERFRGPAAVASRPGGRFVVAAVHAPTGELWTWEFAHTTGALPSTTPIRTFRRVRSAVVAANLPDGRPVGFVKDVQGRWWAIDLDVKAPEQPHWKQLDIPAAAVAPVGELTAVTTPAGIQLAGRTASGDVVTGTYAAGTTSLGWHSLGAVDTVSKVGLGVAQSGDLRLAVRHSDSSVWSASLDPATGLTVDGWHPVGVPDPAVAPVGTPSVVYDPQTQRNGILVRSGATSGGALYRVWEATPGSGDFSGAFTGVSLESSGISSDLTTWDHRTEEPLYRRWSFLYVDGSGAKRIGGSFVS